MSDASTPPPVPEAPPPDNPPASLPAPARRDGCVTALMVVGGLVLLFPAYVSSHSLAIAACLA